VLSRSRWSRIVTSELLLNSGKQHAVCRQQVFRKRHRLFIVLINVSRYRYRHGDHRPQATVQSKVGGADNAVYRGVTTHRRELSIFGLESYGTQEMKAVVEVQLSPSHFEVWHWRRCFLIAAGKKNVEGCRFRFFVVITASVKPSRTFQVHAYRFGEFVKSPVVGAHSVQPG
jgi:hypothetical protein